MNNTNQIEWEEYKKQCRGKKQNPSIKGFCDWKRDSEISIKGWNTRRNNMINVIIKFLFLLINVIIIEEKTEETFEEKQKKRAEKNIAKRKYEKDLYR